MTIEIKTNGQETILEVIGRLDTTTSPALENAVNDNLAQTNNLVLDLKALEYISSAGLRVLLSAQKKIQPNGSMKLINVSADVMEIFEMTGFADILEIV